MHACGHFLVLGCDSTSSFFGRGKARAFKAARKSENFAEAFATLGEDLNLPDDIATLLKQYVCCLYGKIKSINYARYTMFKLGKCTADSLPSNIDSLHQDILLANFESYICKHATTPILASPSPAGYGWRLEDNQLQIVWGTQEPAPESILECVHCKWKKGSKTRRYSCYKSDLKCTELFRCNSCENSDILADELSELEAQFLENEFELEECDVDDDDY